MDYTKIKITESNVENWRNLCKGNNNCTSDTIKEKIKCAIDNGAMLSDKEILCFDLLLTVASDNLIGIDRYSKMHKPTKYKEVSKIFKIKDEFKYLGDGRYEKLNASPQENTDETLPIESKKSKLKHSQKHINMINNNFNKTFPSTVFKCDSIIGMYNKSEELKNKYNDFVLDKLMLNLYCWNNPYYKHTHMQTIELDNSWRTSRYRNYTDKISIITNIKQAGFKHIRIDGNIIYYKK